MSACTLFLVVPLLIAACDDQPTQSSAEKPKAEDLDTIAMADLRRIIETPGDERPTDWRRQLFGDCTEWIVNGRMSDSDGNEIPQPELGLREKWVRGDYQVISADRPGEGPRFAQIVKWDPVGSRFHKWIVQPDGLVIKALGDKAEDDSITWVVEQDGEILSRGTQRRVGERWVSEEEYYSEGQVHMRITSESTCVK